MFYTVHATTLGILFSKPLNLDVRLGGCGTRVIDGIFFKFFRRLLKTEVALITHLKVDLYLGTPTHSVVDSFIISNYLVPFGPFWLQGRPSSSQVAEPTYR
jgi:hypothetical protein